MSKQKSQPTINPAKASIHILFSNLRLLDLDKEEGWSSVTSQVLASKDAGSNQKARIAAAEWAFFHLSRIWDPNGTADVDLRFSLRSCSVLSVS